MKVTGELSKILAIAERIFENEFEKIIDRLLVCIVHNSLADSRGHLKTTPAIFTSQTYFRAKDVYSIMN